MNDHGPLDDSVGLVRTRSPTWVNARLPLTFEPLLGSSFAVAVGPAVMPAHAARIKVPATTPKTAFIVNPL